ncbi:MAG: metallophosphoesterase family protein [Phaeodactylibacter sp.]|nr:metallophosphoesterase family protein [Phaeodactylibacter sp.]
MKAAVFSDIHEDVAALEKAIAKTETLGCQEIICLGDIVGFSVPFYDHLTSRNASKCIELIKDTCSVIVLGNHDLFAIKQLPFPLHPLLNLPADWYTMDYPERKKIANGNFWLYENELDTLISKEDKEFLSSLSEFVAKSYGKGINVLFSHFLFPDLTGSGKWSLRIRELLPDHIAFCREKKCKVSFVGHGHPVKPLIISENNELFPLDFEGSIVLDPSIGINIVMVPAIGNRKGKKGFTVFDSDKLELSAIPIG